MRHEIDTSEWKEFGLADVFNMTNTKSIVYSKLLPDSGSIPYVTASSHNNGIQTYVDCPAEWIDKGNCIVIGGKTLTFTYQRCDFCSNDSHNIALHLKEEALATEARYLFLIAALKASLMQHFAWTDSISMKRAAKETFYLPAKSSGEPDWDYMDAYMSDILAEEQAYADELNSQEWHRHSIDSGAWRSYRIGDLFDIRKGTRLTRADMKPGTTPFIGATLENNGITAFVGNDEHIHPGNTITVAYNGQKATGKAFWQPVPFWASDDVSVLYPKFEMTREIALFLVPIFWEVGRPYAFADKWRSEVMTDDELPLPSTPSGEPDWNRMGAYMSRLVDEEVGRVAALHGRLGSRQA